LACCQAIGQAGNTLMFAATALSVVTFYHNRDLDRKSTRLNSSH
jgi:hypothetical protein